ncbi:hypothetical protein POTOM_000227 [Populus tomentosa]|uniref:Chalcone/stilbene synthase C-terminal domain-containing protein n=1 Tax=Populus tomentosa TaxID=118781 RepID=A0A8X8APQ4_POPTO|nr:hypothetical protein POTOM_000227 [Populus tomentosa]
MLGGDIQCTIWDQGLEFSVLHCPSWSVFFVLDEMRRRSAKEGKATTGEGLDPGVLFGFGPGVTIETIVLRSFATD